MRVKHAFAALKGRFQSLHELRMKIQTKKDVKVAVYWVMSCIILHNMIIRFEEEMGDRIESTTEWAVEEGRNLQDGDADVVADAVGTAGQQFRMKLSAELLQHLRNQHT